MTATAAGASPVHQPVRPRAWLCELVQEDGTIRTQIVEQDPDGLRWNDFGEPSPYRTTPLYDQAALVAALALWPRDCRLCANFTSKTGGCVSLVQCVDSMQFKATAPRQYWVAGPNVCSIRETRE